MLDLGSGERLRSGAGSLVAGKRIRKFSDPWRHQHGVRLRRAGRWRAWRIAEHPDADQPPLSIVDLQNESLSVSGIGGKSFIDDAGLEQGHVIDPRTGRPTQAARVAAVVCQSATVSDAWATALLVARIWNCPRIKNRFLKRILSVRIEITELPFVDDRREVR